MEGRGRYDSDVEEVVKASIEPMSEELKAKVNNFTPVERNYAMYRAKGLTQSESMRKAGSKTKSVQDRSKQGYIVERKDGMKEYITYLSTKNAVIGVVTQDELVENTRKVISLAMEQGRFGDACKAIELLGNFSGHLDSKKGTRGITTAMKDTNKARYELLGGKYKDQEVDPGVAAFKDAEDEEVSKQEQLQKIKKIMTNLKIT